MSTPVPDPRSRSRYQVVIFEATSGDTDPRKNKIKLSQRRPGLWMKGFEHPNLAEVLAKARTRGIDQSQAEILTSAEVKGQRELKA